MSCLLCWVSLRLLLYLLVRAGPPREHRAPEAGRPGLPPLRVFHRTQAVARASRQGSCFFYENLAEFAISQNVYFAKYLIFYIHGLIKLECEAR
jgi:hypothetical protein